MGVKHPNHLQMLKGSFIFLNETNGSRHEIINTITNNNLAKTVKYIHSFIRCLMSVNTKEKLQSKITL